MNVTVDTEYTFKLRAGDSIFPIMYKIPKYYRRNLNRILTERKTAIFAHPMLDMDLKTRCYRWRIKPFQHGDETIYKFSGKEIDVPPERHGEISVHLSHHGVMWGGV